MTKPKSERVKEAQPHLARAREQLDRAQVDSWDPADPAECVTKCFYAYENAVVAAATAMGIAWTKRHDQKAALARRMFQENTVKTDVGDRLAKLNELRKDISYGEPGEELSEVDLEGLVSDLEAFLDEVNEIVSSLEEE